MWVVLGPLGRFSVCPGKTALDYIHHCEGGIWNQIKKILEYTEGNYLIESQVRSNNVHRNISHFQMSKRLLNILMFSRWNGAVIDQPFKHIGIFFGKNQFELKEFGNVVGETEAYHWYNKPSGFVKAPKKQPNWLIRVDSHCSVGKCPKSKNSKWDNLSNFQTVCPLERSGFYALLTLWLEKDDRLRCSAQCPGLEYYKCFPWDQREPREVSRELYT